MVGAVDKPAKGDPMTNPISSRTVQPRLGGNTFTGHAMRESNIDGRAHAGLAVVETAHIAAETGHAAHIGWHVGAEVAVALAPVAVGVAGLAFGIAVHHEVEEQRARFRAIAAEVGIR